MRRVVYTETGDPDVLRLIEEPTTEPGRGEVRVKIHRAGVNPTDWKSRRGGKPGDPVSPAQTPGQDGSGVVDAVGEGVEVALLGLRVWVWEAPTSDGTERRRSIRSSRPSRWCSCPTSPPSIWARPSLSRSSPPTGA